MKKLWLPTVLVMISTVTKADLTNQIHFQGQFLNAPCVVSADSENQLIDMGQYRTGDILQTGQYTANIPFEIRLVNCDIEVAQTAKFSFFGERDQLDPSLLMIKSDQTPNAQIAQGIGLEIVDANGTPLRPDGVVYSEAKALINGQNTFIFSARYKSTGALVKAGQANADANFLITYQ